MFRRRPTIDPDATPAVTRVVDAARALSNIFTLLFFGGAISIVVLSFSRGV
jgi:phosphosulfolactate phosphohydrolase-like enzyme